MTSMQVGGGWIETRELDPLRAGCPAGPTAAPSAPRRPRYRSSSLVSRSQTNPIAGRTEQPRTPRAQLAGQAHHLQSVGAGVEHRLDRFEGESGQIAEVGAPVPDDRQPVRSELKQQTDLE